MNTRIFHLFPSLKSLLLDIQGKSDPSNAPLKHRTTDIVWKETPHLVWAQSHEAVRFVLHPFAEYTMHAFSVDGIGNEAQWKKEGAGCASPLLITPFADAGEHAIELVLVATAVGPLPSASDQIGLAPPVHAAKCPVKIVFTPRLDG